MQSHRFIVLALVSSTLWTMDVSAQQPKYTYSSTRTSASMPSATTAPTAKPLTQDQISAIVAPIALYPDPLISQILMASTYPLEIVQADRFVKNHKDLKGTALTAELEKQTWDASTKSLVNFPDVLGAMNEKLDLTIKLGDAFIAQQADVMQAIQVLRAKAQAAGNLKSNEQQKVTVEAAPPTTNNVNVTVQQAPPQTQVIQIQPTNPETIYVPSYSPQVVYGSWPYPAYPPYYYYPPAPSYGSNLVSFGLGVAAGAAWGYAWGNCNWGGNDIDIDVDRNTNINNNIDRSKARTDISNRQSNRETNRGAGGQGARTQGAGRSSFQHDPAHRGGVPYRDQASAQKFGGADRSSQAAAARDSYRGRTSAGSGSAFSGMNSVGGSSGARTNTGGSRTGSYGGSSAGGARTNSYSGSSGLSGVDRGGSAARSSSQRGQTSRSSPSYSRSAPARSAPSRSSGGGASRGGGGGGRGGGRR